MPAPHPISDKYNKYLLEVILEGHSYYTVMGADRSDEFAAKVLTNTAGEWLLFTTPADLYKAILEAGPSFDQEHITAWAKEVGDHADPHATINLDLLVEKDLDANSKELFYGILISLGLIEDFAIQIENEALLNILDTDIILDLREYLVDFFNFGVGKSFKIPVDVEHISRSLQELFQQLRPLIKQNILPSSLYR